MAFSVLIPINYSAISTGSECAKRRPRAQHTNSQHSYTVAYFHSLCALPLFRIESEELSKHELEQKLDALLLEKYQSSTAQHTGSSATAATLSFNHREATLRQQLTTITERCAHLHAHCAQIESELSAIQRGKEDKKFNGLMKRLAPKLVKALNEAATSAEYAGTGAKHVATYEHITAERQKGIARYSSTPRFSVKDDDDDEQSVAADPRSPPRPSPLTSTPTSSATPSGSGDIPAIRAKFSSSGSSSGGSSSQRDYNSPVSSSASSRPLPTAPQEDFAPTHHHPSSSSPMSAGAGSSDGPFSGAFSGRGEPLHTHHMTTQPTMGYPTYPSSPTLSGSGVRHGSSGIQSSCDPLAVMASLSALRPSSPLGAAARTEAHKAAADNRPQKLSIALDASPDSLNATDSDGCTPLHLAAMKGSSAACRVLIDRGARTDVKDASGRTPRDVASAYDAAEVLKLLSGGSSSGSATSETTRSSTEFPKPPQQHERNASAFSFLAPATATSSSTSAVRSYLNASAFPSTATMGPTLPDFNDLLGSPSSGRAPARLHAQSGSSNTRFQRTGEPPSVAPLPQLDDLLTPTPRSGGGGSGGGALHPALAKTSSMMRKQKAFFGAARAGNVRAIADMLKARDADVDALDAVRVE